MKKRAKAPRKGARPAKQANIRQRGHATRTSWRPGQSGNPNGRPPGGNALAAVLRDYLDEPATKGTTVDRKRTLVARLYRAATARTCSVAAAKLLFEVAGGFETEARIAALEAGLAAMKREKEGT